MNLWKGFFNQLFPLLKRSRIEKKRSEQSGRQNRSYNMLWDRSSLLVPNTQLLPLKSRINVIKYSRFKGKKLSCREAAEILGVRRILCRSACVTSVTN